MILGGLSVRIGLVGKPNVGKSTFFAASTLIPVDIANYPFCTIDPNVGIVAVPDYRLENLQHVSRSFNSQGVAKPKHGTGHDDYLANHYIRSTKK